ncbi:MAG: hypothetical protein ACREHG_04770, partial [Candidatus Saccharimonadales bacterium]
LAQVKGIAPNDLTMAGIEISHACQQINTLPTRNRELAETNHTLDTQASILWTYCREACASYGRARSQLAERGIQMDAMHSFEMVLNDRLHLELDHPEKVSENFSIHWQAPAAAEGGPSSGKKKDKGKAHAGPSSKEDSLSEREYEGMLNSPLDPKYGATYKARFGHSGDYRPDDFDTSSLGRVTNKSYVAAASTPGAGPSGSTSTHATLSATSTKGRAALDAPLSLPVSRLLPDTGLIAGAKAGFDSPFMSYAQYVRESGDVHQPLPTTRYPPVNRSGKLQRD